MEQLCLLYISRDEHRSRWIVFEDCRLGQSFTTFESSFYCWRVGGRHTLGMNRKNGNRPARFKAQASARTTSPCKHLSKTELECLLIWNAGHFTSWNTQIQRWTRHESAKVEAQRHPAHDSTSIRNKCTPPVIYQNRKYPSLKPEGQIIPFKRGSVHIL